MTLPTFIIGGPAKAGTTALWSWLDHHPEVFMASEKEPRFFTRRAHNPAPGVVAPRMSSGDRYSRGLAWYEALFEGGERYAARGEASTQYIGALDGPELMQRHVPDLKIFFILRNPIVRAYSHYSFHVNRGRERGDERADLPPFEAALDDDPRLRYFLYFSRYEQHVERYRQVFGQERVHLVLFDDLRQRPAETFADVCRAIGVSDTYQPSFEREYNPSGTPIVGPLQRAISRTKDWRPSFLPRRLRRPLRRARERLEELNRRKASHPTLDPDVYQRFVQIFEADIAYVERLTRPLPEWRVP